MAVDVLSRDSLPPMGEKITQACIGYYTPNSETRVPYVQTRSPLAVRDRGTICSRPTIVLKNIIFVFAMTILKFCWNCCRDEPHTGRIQSFPVPLDSPLLFFDATSWRGVVKQDEISAEMKKGGITEKGRE